MSAKLSLAREIQQIGVWLAYVNPTNTINFVKLSARQGFRVHNPIYKKFIETNGIYKGMCVCVFNCTFYARGFILYLILIVATPFVPRLVSEMKRHVSY